jgi:hypothetical protein
MTSGVMRNSESPFSCPGRANPYGCHVVNA